MVQCEDFRLVLICVHLVDSLRDPQFSAFELKSTTARPILPLVNGLVVLPHIHSATRKV